MRGAVFHVLHLNGHESAVGWFRYEEVILFFGKIVFFVQKSKEIHRKWWVKSIRQENELELNLEDIICFYIFGVKKEETGLKN